MKRPQTRFVRILNRLAESFTLVPTPNRRKHHLSSVEYRALEHRRLLAVFTVDTISDDLNSQPDGQISLREAITAANTNAAFGDAAAGDSSPDFIRFASSIAGQTISLSGTELEITDGLVIRGDNANITIDAGGQSRIFSVNTDQRIAFTELTLTGGNAREGGAVLTQGEGRVQFFRSTITNNRATASRSGGGGILNLDSDVFLANSQVTDNFSHGLGGGVFSAFGVVRLFESALTSNEAEIGGGVAIGFGDLFSSGSQISSNETSSDPAAPDRDDDSLGLLGGVLSGGATSLSLSGGGIALVGTNATSVINNTEITENISPRAGGGIYIGADNRVYLSNGTDVSLNQAIVTRSNGFGFTSGGGISNSGLLRATDVTFSGNSATAEIDGGSGGAISSRGVLSIHRSTFTDNVAQNGGGAIVAGGQLNVSASTFSGNRSAGSPFPHRSSEGGAILVGAPNAVIDGSTFEENVGGDHGGAVTIRSGDLQISNSRFLQNVSLSQDSQVNGSGGGGAIFNDEASLRIYSSTFAGNTAKTKYESGGEVFRYGRGGAIYSKDGTLEVAGSSFFDNVAEGSGGALAITDGGDALVFESTFGDENGRGNLARLVRSVGTFSLEGTNLGGAIFVDGRADNATSLRLQGSTLAGNKARNSGGGLWAGEHTQVQVYASRSQPTRFIGNQALAHDGGGAFLQSNDVIIADAVFESNKARDGAGIYTDGADLTLVRSQITSNEARRRGDDFFDNTDFFSNFASTVGDVFEV